jgi:hypothetical protein
LQQSFRCPKCGAQITVGQLFCGVCGQRFEYRCRHCGNSVADASGFCTSCGGKLYHRPQHVAYRHEAKVEHTVQRPMGQIGRYMVVIAIIVFMVGIIYMVGTSSQGDSSNWLGGYNFAGQSPPSTPPSTTSPDSQPLAQPESEPQTVSNSNLYTVDQVIAAAKKFSPDCRLQTGQAGRTG